MCCRYDLYSFQVIPNLGELIAGDRESYQYLVESVRRFPPQVHNFLTFHLSFLEIWLMFAVYKTFLRLKHVCSWLVDLMKMNAGEIFVNDRRGRI